MVRRGIALLTCVVALVAASACGSGGSSTDRFDVVAAFYPLAEAARAVGGAAVEVHDLTPAGVEPHDLELRPSDAARIRSADLIVYLGGGFQPALEDALEASPNRAAGLDLLEGLTLMPGDAAAPDPHVWLDPRRMIRIVERIEGELGERLPSARETFAANAAAYIDTLEELDRSFEATLRTCTRKAFVTAHAAFGYLAARYGLEQVAISGLTPEAEPSPRRLQEVAALAERLGVTTIYFETLVDPRVARSLARTVGARTAVLDPIEGLTDDRLAKGDSYTTVMRRNLAALTEGLGCRPA